MQVAWVRHRGTPQATACLLDLATWRSMCGSDWNGPTSRSHWAYYEPVDVPEPAHISKATGHTGDNACSLCIKRSWRLAVRGELEVRSLLDSQPPLPMAVHP